MTLRAVPVVLALVLAAPAQTDPDGSDAGPTALPEPVECPGCWHPEPGTTWQWQLTGKIDRSLDVDMYDVDMFDVPARTMDALHDDGRVAVCYISAGSWERWRPDAGRFPHRVLGKPLEGWPGERWLDIRRLHLLGPIMKRRMDRCVAKGFDGVEFDNVDGFTNATGFPLRPRHQLRYNVWLANQAHRRGLSVGLKNDLGQVRRLRPYFDWAMNEQCFQFEECWRLAPFIQAGKAVFEVEYDLSRSEFCSRAVERRFSSMRKHRALGPWRRACPG